MKQVSVSICASPRSLRNRLWLSSIMARTNPARHGAAETGERGVGRSGARIPTGGRAMKPRLPIPTGFPFGVRRHDSALALGDLSPRGKARTCPRTPKPAVASPPGIQKVSQPQRGSSTPHLHGCNPVGVGFRCPGSPRVARASQPRADGCSPVGAEAVRAFPSTPSRTHATLRDTLLPKLLSGELSVATVNA